MYQLGAPCLKELARHRSLALNVLQEIATMVIRRDEIGGLVVLPGMNKSIKIRALIVGIHLRDSS